MCDHPQPFRLQRRSATSLAVVGELDLASSAELERALRDDRVEEVDMSAVTFIDVAGVRPLLAAAGGRGRRLVVQRPSRCVRRLFQLLDIGLDVVH